jgi:hypothetical protein
MVVERMFRARLRSGCVVHATCELGPTTTWIGLRFRGPGSPETDRTLGWDGAPEYARTNALDELVKASRDLGDPVECVVMEGQRMPRRART